ncbi:hypothetical protein OS493_037246 [Desmophyllum pertusum]|uniref:Uncharacterized protein n=1 Tax=Desmophyllum pertusum TaxID=174260 RepID=A0A9W9Z9K5_9CNID|nr:hypothetical protein OS493_037246 [Desmophyllum pertusum]
MALDQRHIPQGARTLCYPLGGNRAATATTEDGQGNASLLDLLGQLKDQNAHIIDQLTASQGDGNNGTVEKKKQVPKRVERTLHHVVEDLEKPWDFRIYEDIFPNQSKTNKKTSSRDRTSNPSKTKEITKKA